MDEPNEGGGERRSASDPHSQDISVTDAENDHQIIADAAENESTPTTVQDKPASDSVLPDGPVKKIETPQPAAARAQVAPEGVIDDTFAYMRAQNVTIKDALPKPGEPAKIDISAASAEPAPVLHLGGTFTPASKSSDSAEVPETITTPAPDLAPSALAIDNPHPVAPQIHKGVPSAVVVFILVLLGAAAGFAGAAASGYSFREPQVKTVTNTVTAEPKEITVPEGVTLLNECTPGRGKQYTQQAKAPIGPIYNVHEDKVIGLEYRLSQKQMQANKDYLNLLLEGISYDHVDIGFVAKGDASFAEPHYRLSIFAVSSEETAKITCN
jgi:hypothetical protein